MNSTNLMIVLIVLLVIIYLYSRNIDHFDPNLSQSFQPVNYNTLKQNFHKLTNLFTFLKKKYQKLNIC